MGVPEALSKSKLEALQVSVNEVEPDSPPHDSPHDFDRLSMQSPPPQLNQTMMQPHRPMTHESGGEWEAECERLEESLREARSQKERAVEMRVEADRQRDEYVGRWEAKCREVERLGEERRKGRLTGRFGGSVYSRSVIGEEDERTGTDMLGNVHDWHGTRPHSPSSGNCDTRLGELFI